MSTQSSLDTLYATLSLDVYNIGYGGMADPGGASTLPVDVAGAHLRTTTANDRTPR